MLLYTATSILSKLYIWVQVAFENKIAISQSLTLSFSSRTNYTQTYHFALLH